MTREVVFDGMCPVNDRHMGIDRARWLGPVVEGKETLALAGWLGSWVILHFVLRKRDLEISRWLVLFLAGVGIATTLIWPPVFEYLAGHK